MFKRGPNASAAGTVEQNGRVIEETTKTLDCFKDLLKGGDEATVSATYALGRDFNSEKVTFHVTVRCAQDEATINQAGERVFLKAMEFVGDACEQLGWAKKA